MNNRFYVMDTNIPLLSLSFYEQYKDGIIVIPHTVIVELDGLKQGHSGVAVNARATNKLIGRISEQMVDNNHIIEIPEGKFKIMLPLKHEDIDYLKEDILDFNVKDDKIIYTAILTKIKNPSDEVILCSNDINVRSKVMCLYDKFKVKALAYEEDKVKSTDELYRTNYYEISDNTLLDKLYQGKLKKEDLSVELYINSPLTINNQMFRVDKSGFIKSIDEHGSYKIKNFKPCNIHQKHLVDLIINSDIQFVGVIGRSGCGKSITAIASMLHLLDNGEISQIIIAKAYAPVGRSVGMLKGTWEDKTELIKSSFRTVFMMLGRNLDLMEESGRVRFTTGEFDRGENFINCGLVLDEVQSYNSTTHLKTLLTRLDESSKCVILGDIAQCDEAFHTETFNPLSVVVSKLNGQEFFSSMYMDKSVRNKNIDIIDDLL